MFKLSYIRDFVEAHIKLHQTKLPPHEEEQVMYRAIQCADCTKNQKCLKCGCPTPQLYFAPNRVDAEGKWGKFMDKEQWEQFKKDNPNALIPDAD